MIFRRALKAINQSIRWQLLAWFLVFALLPMLIVSGISYFVARDSLYSAAAYQLRNESISNRDFVMNWFDYRHMDISRESRKSSTVRLLESLSFGYQNSQKSLADYVISYDWVKRSEEWQRDLFQLIRQTDYIYDIFIIDHNANILFTILKEADFGTNLVDGEFANSKFARTTRQTLSSGETLFSDFEQYPPSKNKVFGFITAPIIDLQGERIGVFAIQIRINRIAARFEKSSARQLASYLLGNDGFLRTPINAERKSEILSRRVDTHATKSTQIKKIKHGKSSQSKERITEYLGPNGVPVLGVSEAVKIWNVEWLLISEIDVSDALASANWLGLTFSALVLITAIFVAICAIPISRRFTDPIIELVKTTERAAQNEVVSPIVSTEENELGVLSNSLNVMLEAQQQHENQLVSAKEVAEQSSRAKSEFLACMSHEIRTPMNGVLGMLDVLSKSDLNRDQLQKLNVAKSSAKSLLTIINDILDYSKVEAGKLEFEELQFDIQKLIGEAVHAFAVRAEEKS